MDTKALMVISIPGGHIAEIQATADAAGKTLNDFIVKAIDERIDRFGRSKENPTDLKASE